MSGTLFNYTSFGYTSPTPNVTDFINMLTTEVGIPSDNISAASPFVTASLAYAVNMTYEVINCLDNALYLRAVYCLATERCIYTGIDTASNLTPTTSFTGMRSAFNMYRANFGLVQSSNDESTGQSLLIPDSLKNLTLFDLNNMKTPWGVEYTGYAQQASPIWGIS